MLQLKVISKEKNIWKGLQIRKKFFDPSREKFLSGEQEAALIAMRLSSPPSGYGSWTLNLLKNEMIALEIVERSVKKRFVQG